MVKLLSEFPGSVRAIVQGPKDQGMSDMRGLRKTANFEPKVGQHE